MVKFNVVVAHCIAMYVRYLRKYIIQSFIKLYNIGIWRPIYKTIYKPHAIIGYFYK